MKKIRSAAVLFLCVWMILQTGGTALAAESADVRATCTVTLDPNGGYLPQNEPGVYTVTYGELYGAPVYVQPERRGYLFAGWFDDSGCRMAFDTVVARTDDHTLTAHWQKPVVTIRDAGDGVRAVAYGETVTFTADVQDGPPEAVVQWYRDGQYFAQGESCTVPNITSPFTLQANLFGTSIESEPLHVCFTGASNPLGRYFGTRFSELSETMDGLTVWSAWSGVVFLSLPIAMLLDKLGASAAVLKAFLKGLQGVAAVPIWTAKIVGAPFLAAYVAAEWGWNTLFQAW